MRHPLPVILLALIFISCNPTPERYEVYKNLLDDSKGQVRYVGTNWQIKDAVNADNIVDFPFYHTESFWSHPNDEILISLLFVSPKVSVAVLPLEKFLKHYKKLSP